MRKVCFMIQYFMQIQEREKSSEKVEGFRELFSTEEATRENESTALSKQNILILCGYVTKV